MKPNMNIILNYIQFLENIGFLIKILLKLDSHSQFRITSLLAYRPQLADLPSDDWNFNSMVDQLFDHL